MEFIRRSAVRPARLAIVPGAFNPPTLAHLALARAALSAADEVLFVLPRVFPHKGYAGASLEERLSMLEALVQKEPRFSIAVTQGGLFADIARECRAAYPPGIPLYIVCGSDAARRAVHWDYGSAGAFEKMMEDFEMLVAERGEVFEPPAELRRRIHPLPVPSSCRGISATEVRERILHGGEWRPLVPDEIAGMVAAIFGRQDSSDRGERDTPSAG